MSDSIDYIPNVDITIIGCLDGTTLDIGNQTLAREDFLGG